MRPLSHKVFEKPIVNTKQKGPLYEYIVDKKHCCLLPLKFFVKTFSVRYSG